MRAERTHIHPHAHLVWGILVTCLLLALPALAQDPVVTAADPPSAEQETLDLEVTVTGDNFDKDAKVDFFVTGTTNPGGILVKGKPKILGPKKLKVKIDVGADAVIDNFDIQVMSRGRTGKGIELFRVTEKTHPTQDTTPPGVPKNFQVLDVTYGSVTVSFTMPADDGYDETSGPATYCPILATPMGGEPSNGRWTPDLPWGQPGETERVILSPLDPETTYLFSLRCYDGLGGNASPAIEFEETTYPFSAFQDLSWAVTEVPVHLDTLIGHRFDAAGNVGIAGTVGTWQKKGWRTRLVSSTIRIITGTWDAGSWSWSVEDVPGFADRIASHPGGRAAFVGQELTETTPRATYEVTYTFFDGSTWKTELVSTFETEAAYGASPGFAFDSFGVPGITWCAGAGSPGVRLARRDPTGQWSVENVNSASCDGRETPILAFDDSGDPAILWTHGNDPYELRFTHATPEGWSEEFVDALRPGNDWNVRPAGLGFDPVRGDFTAVWASGIDVSACDRNGVADWSCDAAMPLGSATKSEMALHPTGEVMFGAATYARGVVLARRPPYDPNNPGQELTWTLEHVDHWTTDESSDVFHGGGHGGPFVALDMGDRPTLSWLLGNIGGDEGPSEDVHLYFAWKP